MLVISCHADTRFREHQLQREGVRVELTYCEETGFAGAYEVLQTLRGWDVVVVVDVTGTPTDKDFVVEKCTHPEMRRLIDQTLAGMAYDLHEGCPDPVCGLDETEVYRDACPMTCFLGLPVTGGDYNNEVVRCKEQSIRAVAEALCRIAQGWAQEQKLKR